MTAEPQLFREVQPMHQNMILRVILPIEAAVIGLVMLALALGPSRQQAPQILLGFIAFGVVLPGLLMALRLVTTVTRQRVVVRFWPFPGRDIPAADIRSAQAVRYNPLGDAGGWGWRFSRTYHRVFNVWGHSGVHIRYGDTDKDQFLVGSRRAEELAHAIDLARFAATEQAASPGEPPAPR